MFASNCRHGIFFPFLNVQANYVSQISKETCSGETSVQETSDLSLKRLQVDFTNTGS